MFIGAKHGTTRFHAASGGRAPVSIFSLFKRGPSTAVLTVLVLVLGALVWTPPAVAAASRADKVNATQLAHPTVVALPEVSAPTSELPVRTGLAATPRKLVSYLAPFTANADPVVTQPSGWTTTLSMTVDTRVHLTYTVSPAITYASPVRVELHDLGAPADSTRVDYLRNGSTLDYTTTPEYPGSRYVAVVTPVPPSSSTSRAMPADILAVSAVLTPPPWTASISVSPVTTTFAITATTNYAVDNMYRFLSIKDLATGRDAGRAACSSVTVCTATGLVPTTKDSRLVAVVSSRYIPSNAMPASETTVVQSQTYTPPPWTISLSTSGNALTASTNYLLDGSGIWIEIFDLSGTAVNNYVGWCSAGTTCTKTPGNPGGRFIATAGTLANAFPPNPMLAVSNQAGLQGPTAPYETAGGSNPAEMNECFACAGDPINTATGEFFETNVDLLVAGRGPGLRQARTYSTQLAGQKGPLGYGWTTPYSMSLLALPDGSVRVDQEGGSRVTFAQAGTGYAAPPRVLATVAQNPDGTWTYVRRSKEVFTFDTHGRLTSAADLSGNATSISYTAAGNIAAATDPAGRSIAFTYGTNGLLSKATDPAGRAVQYNYDPGGRLTTVTAPGGAITQYSYDASNLITGITSAIGSTTVNSYDSARRVTKQATAAGDLTISYGSDGMTTTTSPGGRVTQETYRGGQLIKRTTGAGTPQAATWTYAYDPSTFARTTVTDPLGRTTSATYDAHGNKLTATDAAGHQATAAYDATDNMVTSTDAAGVATTYTYNATGGRLTASKPLTGSAQSAVVTNAYGDAAHPSDITAVTDPNGNTSTFTFDIYGNRTKAADALGRTTTTTYDILGRKASVTSPSGKKTTYGYDTAGLLTTITDPLGKSKSFTYDAAGNKTSETDRLGHVTAYTYDVLGRNTLTTAPDASTTSSGYDPDGNLTSQTDQAGHVTSYTYDSRNRLTTSADGLNRTTTYAYDAAGQLTSKTDASGRKTTLSYNAAGDKTSTSYSDGATPNEAFTYTALHQPATITDGTGTTTMSYDSLGRLTARTNGSGKTVGYSYDLGGNITGQTYPNGHSVARAYDAANNLTSLTDWLNNTTTFTTTADRKPASTAFANGVTAATSYDDAGQATSITAGTATATLATFSYTRNDNGNLASADTTGIGQPAEAYGYTTRDQLSSVNTVGYSYDPTGNPTSLATGATLAYDAANQPTQFTSAGTTTPITYDNQGNRLTGPAPATGTFTYTWNQANRLTAANGTTFTYDANGLRASWSPASGPAQTYTWDTNQPVPLMLSDGSTSYIYDAAGNPVEHIDASGAVLYYQHDQYGSTRLLTDGSGNVAATYIFDPNGNLTQKTGMADTHLLWNGQLQDADTGLYYLRSRYYDPNTAQFLSVDPLASLTRAIYTYADNNPLNKADPLGLAASPLGTDTNSGISACAVAKAASPSDDDASLEPHFFGIADVTACFIACAEGSVNWIPWTTVYGGYGGGVGTRVEASATAGIGYGTLSPKGNVSVTCSGMLPFGLSVTVNLNSPGGSITGGFGAGGGCSLNFTNYDRLR